MKKLIITTIALIAANAHADTETTKWYIDGKLYETTTCESGADITLPTLPERFGYTFDGWVPAIYDIATLDKSINGTGSTYNASARTWNVTFSYGRLYGKALCSTTSNDVYARNNAGFDTSDAGRYCYCKALEFIPTGSDKIYDVASPSWVFYYDDGSASNCAFNCAYYCASNVRYDSDFRSALFGSLGA